MIRFIFNQYRISRQAGFGGRKAIRRAISAYKNGF